MSWLTAIITNLVVKNTLTITTLTFTIINKIDSKINVKIHKSRTYI